MLLKEPINPTFARFIGAGGQSPNVADYFKPIPTFKFITPAAEQMMVDVRPHDLV